MEANLTTLCALVVILGFGSAAASAFDVRRTAATLKMTAATGYLAVAFVGGAFDTGYGRALFTALLLCWIGDLLLIRPGRGAAFLGGLASFLMGHLAFAWAFKVRGVDYAWMSVGFIVAAFAGLLVSRWLAKHDVPERMKSPVGLYIGAIAVMIGMSVGTFAVDAAWVVPVGAATFMISDIFVARERFVVSSPVNVTIGLPLYFIAQMLLALSV